jgi:hypothetical protein
MKIVAVIVLALIVPERADGAVTVTNVAAVTTIVVNLLEIKANWAKVKVATKATKRVTVKVAKKIVGK